MATTIKNLLYNGSVFAPTTVGAAVTVKFGEATQGTTDNIMSLDDALAKISGNRQNLIKVVSSTSDIKLNDKDAQSYIYLVPVEAAKGEEGNTYAEYIVVEKADKSKALEKIGTMEIDSRVGTLTITAADSKISLKDNGNEISSIAVGTGLITENGALKVDPETINDAKDAFKGQTTLTGGGDLADGDVTITLGGDGAAAGQSITVSYTAPEAKADQELSGDETPDFGDTATISLSGVSGSGSSASITIPALPTDLVKTGDVSATGDVATWGDSGSITVGDTTFSVTLPSAPEISAAEGTGNGEYVNITVGLENGQLSVNVDDSTITSALGDYVTEDSVSSENATITLGSDGTSSSTKIATVGDTEINLSVDASAIAEAAEKVNASDTSTNGSYVNATVSVASSTDGTGTVTVSVDDSGLGTAAAADALSGTIADNESSDDLVSAAQVATYVAEEIGEIEKTTVDTSNKSALTVTPDASDANKYMVDLDLSNVLSVNPSASGSATASNAITVGTTTAETIEIISNLQVQDSALTCDYDMILTK